MTGTEAEGIGNQHLHSSSEARMHHIRTLDLIVPFQFFISEMFIIFFVYLIYASSINRLGFGIFILCTAGAVSLVRIRSCYKGQFKKFLSGKTSDVNMFISGFQKVRRGESEIPEIAHLEKIYRINMINSIFQVYIQFAGWQLYIEDWTLWQKYFLLSFIAFHATSASLAFVSYRTKIYIAQKGLWSCVYILSIASRAWLFAIIFATLPIIWRPLSMVPIGIGCILCHFIAQRSIKNRPEDVHETQKDFDLDKTLQNDHEKANSSTGLQTVFSFADTLIQGPVSHAFFVASLPLILAGTIFAAINYAQGKNFLLYSTVGCLIVYAVSGQFIKIGLYTTHKEAEIPMKPTGELTDVRKDERKGSQEITSNVLTV